MYMFNDSSVFSAPDTDNGFTNNLAKQYSALMTTVTLVAPSNGSDTHPGRDDKISNCDDWINAQHSVFQLANLCMLISFLTPHNFHYHCLFMRAMLNFCYLLTMIWAGVFVCMPDVLVWNSIFFLMNSAYLVYTGYNVVPARFSKALEEIYSHTFKPLRVSRRQFKGIADIGTMQLIGKGTHYAKQDKTKAGLKLSVLLKGRLKVAFDDKYLHSVETNQFIDSPEYDIFKKPQADPTYKVSISATEDSLIFTWTQAQLRKHISRDRAFEHVFGQLIGKDISHKLYEIQERLIATSNLLENYNRRRSSMVNVRSSIVSSSTSNLVKLNCLQGCIYEQPSIISSNGTCETSV